MSEGVDLSEDFSDEGGGRELEVKKGFVVRNRGDIFVWLELETIRLRESVGKDHTPER